MEGEYPGGVSTSGWVCLGGDEYLGLNTGVGMSRVSTQHEYSGVSTEG